MKRRTARGDLVDFDLIKAKQQMGNKPPPKEVSERQEIIDRRLRKKANAMARNPINNVLEKPKREKPVKEEKVETVSNPDSVPSSELPPTESVDAPKPVRKQKTRQTTTTGDNNESTD